MNVRLSASFARCVTVAALALFASANSSLADTTVWNFDLQSTGQDTYYDSATAVCNTAPEYYGYYEIGLVQVWASYLGYTFGPFDVTDQIPEENLSGEGVQAGPPPFDVFAGHVQYPETEPVTLAADLHMWVDADGYGHSSATNIEFGTTEIDLGFPFGTVTVQIEEIRVTGSIEVTPLVPADLDGDGDVDLTDLATMLGNYGLTSGATYEQGDLDGDGDVDLSDLALLLGEYGGWDC